MKDFESITTELAKAQGNLLKTLGENVASETRTQVVSILPDFDAQHKALAYQLQEISKQLGVFAGQSELIENLNQTTKTLGQQFYDERVIQPMVRSLLPLWDLICEVQIKLVNSNSIKSRMYKYISAMKENLQQFFLYYQIKAFSHTELSKFNPRTMRPIKRVTTSDPALDNFVAESLQCGLKMDQRILRLETVSLYKYQEITPNENTENERNLKNDSIRN